MFYIPHFPCTLKPIALDQFKHYAILNTEILDEDWPIGRKQERFSENSKTSFASRLVYTALFTLICTARESLTRIHGRSTWSRLEKMRTWTSTRVIVT